MKLITKRKRGKLNTYAYTYTAEFILHIYKVPSPVFKRSKELNTHTKIIIISFSAFLST